MHLCRSSSNVPCLPLFLEMLQNPHVLLTFEEVHSPLRLPRQTTSEPPKVARTCGVLYILTSYLRTTAACTSSTSQLPKVVWYGVFCTFWLRNLLRTTTVCTFSTSQLPKVVRTRQFLTHFTSKCASRHNGVQLFISHLPRCLRTRRFSEPTFQPSRATKPRKNTVFRDFLTFSHTCIFFLLIFSLLTLLPADCFFISPYCRKFDFQTSFEYVYWYIYIHMRVCVYVCVRVFIYIYVCVSIYYSVYYIYYYTQLNRNYTFVVYTHQTI